MTSIVINAVLQNQRVLFSSKNNKAVDVVVERVNGLTPRPFIMRVGSGESQQACVSSISGLLGDTTTPAHEAAFERTRERYVECLEELRAAERGLQTVVDQRNRVDRLDRDLEEHRRAFGSAGIEQLRSMDPAVLEGHAERVGRLSVAVARYHKRRQSFGTRLLWSLSRGRRRVAAVAAVVDALPCAKMYRVDPPGTEVCEDNIERFLSFAVGLERRQHMASEVVLFFGELRALRSLSDLFDTARLVSRIRQKIAELSLEYVTAWHKLGPKRLSPEDRRVLGNFLPLAENIVRADQQGERVRRDLWRTYYGLLPKIASTLGCWAVTSLSARSKVPFEPGFFDLLVIDEASQCDIASAVPLLYRAKRAVIIGDPNQLRHITSVRQRDNLQLLARHGIMQTHMSWSYPDSSLFDLARSLCSHDNMVILRDHHRSHDRIIRFSNKEFYQENLRVATRYENLKLLRDEPVVRWVHVAGRAARSPSGGSMNLLEAEAVVTELRRILDNGYRGSIGVVTPFQAQARRMNDLIAADGGLSDRLYAHDFQASTVHRFQGDERDLVVFSPVVGPGIRPGSVRFLARTGNLFNVAITRARAALIVVGNRDACSRANVPYLQRFVRYVEQEQDGAEDEFDPGELTGQYPEYATRQTVSDWEKMLYGALFRAGIKTTPQYPVEKYRLDLALPEGDRRLDIEVDGEFHRDWDGELVRSDRLRNHRMIELGWDVMRFWVYEVRDDLEGCIDRVRAWIGG